MSEEYFDVLDEIGNLTGSKKSRKEVHRDGDWHRTVHVWIFNENGDVLLQRRCSTKELDQNMLDISCAGHLSAGDDSITAALRELKEELNIDVDATELEYIQTSTRAVQYGKSFINNEFEDLYFLRTKLKIENMEYQKEEISEIFYVTYQTFKKMIADRNPELVMYDDEFAIIFDHFDPEFNQ